MARTIGLVFEDAEKESKAPENKPNRKELLEKATQLGLDFKGNISNADLINLIEDAEKESKAPENKPETPELDPDGEE